MAIRLRRQLSEEELIEVLCRNMSIHLRKALWREHFVTVDDLLSSCNDFERLCAEENQQSLARRTMRISELEQPVPEYDEDNAGQQYVDALGGNNIPICWNCRDIGHSFMQCDKAQRGVFCFSCGMSGVMKINCPKCSGNARRDVKMAGTTRSPGLPVPSNYQYRPQSTQQAPKQPFNPSQS